MDFTRHQPGATPRRDRLRGPPREHRSPAGAPGRPPDIRPVVVARVTASGGEAGASLDCAQQPTRPRDSQRTPPRARRHGPRQAAGARQDASARLWSHGGRSSKSPRCYACDGPRSTRTTQADSFARPLRRRLARMARPARVRMRRRKPCLRARRRLLGWYVRLLTSGSSRRGWSHLRRSLPYPRSAPFSAGA
jgi:hypothetical protein